MDCPCGQPLHYSVPAVREQVDRLVDQLGPCVTITTPEGSWLVPRHYIALHGVSADQLGDLAVELGFEPVA